MIRISEPVIGDAEEKLVLEVLRSGRLVQGPMVERFEESVREAVGAAEAIAVNNGTSALVAALQAHGVGRGDEAILPPFTFVATLNALLQVGATPRFADIGSDFNIDPESLERVISPTTRVVMPVHLYGLPSDLAAIRATAEQVGALVIEDAAQALGAAVDGVSIGATGTSCFSFYATKILTTGEGGLVATDDPLVAEHLRILRNQGQRDRYDYAFVGHNYRMTELQAALGVAQMGRMSELIEQRRINATELTERLQGVDGLVLPRELPGRLHVYHQYTVRVTAEARLARDALAERLRAHGIECGVYYPRPVFDYPCFRHDPRLGNPHVPEAVLASGQVLSLPVHPALDAHDIDRISSLVRQELS
ncbi:MAG: DegT/DnrJ/EryC1/StrS family aminotransferase [Acidimicrobiia bacterium]|nr:DegT/DnrJ/EryC1/StrS family aminotransferase [Acidimicrobiia bacterium]